MEAPCHQAYQIESFSTPSGVNYIQHAIQRLPQGLFYWPRCARGGGGVSQPPCAIEKNKKLFTDWKEAMLRADSRSRGNTPFSAKRLLR